MAATSVLIMVLVELDIETLGVFTRTTHVHKPGMIPVS